MPISSSPVHSKALIFLSSNTQDFIEVIHPQAPTTTPPSFLSSNTQDFIEVVDKYVIGNGDNQIPEL